jgi:hypothetical protein
MICFDWPTSRIPDTEFSRDFIQGMLNRMAMSWIKYGNVREAYPHRVNALKSLEQRITKYIETGNTEYLMDVANFAMIEFMHPSVPDAHFTATDSDGSPGRTWNYGTVSAKPNVEKFTYTREGD